MKAEDLMIGDWVVGNNKQPFQIGIIDPSFKYWNEIKPIPLTSEILEKNGFGRKGTDFLIKGFLYWSSFAKRIFVQGHPDQIDWIDVCECQYVHELQHLLKQYKIEKEIVL